jgi:hypothetical protein
MRPWVSLSVSFVAVAVLALAAAPAHADELAFTLDSYIGYGMPTSLNPDPDSCLPPNCVLFTGTLTDNDVDPQPDTNPSYLGIGTPYTDASDMVTFDGVLSLDNVAPTGVLSGDTEWATDGLLNPANTYSGPIFGVDIPTGTPAGVYVDAVNLDIYPTNGNSQFTVSATVTVVVAPEPAVAGLMLGGLAALATWWGVRRKWPSLEASR